MLLRLMPFMSGTVSSGTIYMANGAGLHSAWARFGALYNNALWLQLVRVTHWTEADVEREERLTEQAHGTKSDCIVDKFSDLIRYFAFNKNP